MLLFHGKGKRRISVVVSRVLLRYMEAVKGILLWIVCTCSIGAFGVKLRYRVSASKPWVNHSSA